MPVQQAEALPQHELPCPDATRSAAWPYFSFTTSFTLVALILAPLLTAQDLLGFDGLVAGATFRIEEAQQVLQSIRVGRVPQERALTAHADQVLVLKFFQMMGERAGWDVELAADLTDNQAFGVRAQQQAQDPQSRLRTDRREPVRATGN